MSLVPSPSFARGWVPDADAVGGPKDCLLRADNTTQDEIGVVGLRQGSAKINSSAFADTDVHSLFTAVLSGTRYRMAGAGAAVYANGASLATGFAGSGDIAFGSHMGQILMARSTTKQKYDGSTVRNWGIAQTGGAPTVAALAADSKVLASFASGESGTWSFDEGTGVLGNVTGQDGAAGGATEVTPNADTARGTVTRVFGAAQNYSVYDAGQVGTDDDLIEFYVYVPEPERLAALTVMVDINASSAARFQDDYFMYEFRLDEPVDLGVDSEAFLDDNYAAEGVQRRMVRAKREPRPDGSTVFRRDKPVTNAGWNKLQIRRGRMRRIGTTSGKGWDTVIAVRVTFRMTQGGADSALRLDAMQIVGGANRPLTGKYKYCAVLVRDDSTYQAKSAPSAFSAEFLFKAQGGNVTVPADASRDGQANKLWLFRMGGEMDAFYRVATADVSGTGAVTIEDVLSDRDAMILNIRLETDNAVPPDNIIDIEGPYFDRTFCLTSSGYLYPSKRLNPDSFSAAQVVRVAAPDETAYWVKKAFGGLYIGTSKDVYTLTGTGAELPDGTVDFTLTPLNVSHPPIGDGLAQEGNVLVYLANDGWRALSGSGASSIVGSTSLLYRGYTRHGVSPVNLGTGRFRAAMTKGQFVALTPEGTSTTSTSTVYRYVFGSQQWYRHTYTPTFRCLLREPDGTLIASDASGFVRVLDTGTQDDGANIPVVLWTTADDNGQPFSDKEAYALQVSADTGGQTLSIAAHLDDSATASDTLTTSQTGMGAAALDVTDLDLYRQLQLRLTGSFSTFRFGGFAVASRVLPMGVTAWDSGPMDLGVQDLVWIREVRLKVRATADLTVTPYFDGVAFDTVTLDVTSDNVSKYCVISVPVGRGYKGVVPRVVITSSGKFSPYWVEFLRRSTTAKLDKRIVRIPIGGEAAA